MMDEATSQLAGAQRPEGARAVLRRSPINARRAAVTDEDIRRVRESLTFEECLEVSVVPIVVGRLAWDYAWKARDYCRDRRMGGVFVRLSRQLDAVRLDYVRGLGLERSGIRLETLETAADTLMDGFRKDLTLLWFSVNGEILRLYPDMDHKDMRTDACMAIIMVLALKERCAEVSKWLGAKAGVRIGMDRDLERMAALMRLYSGRVDVSGSRHVKTGHEILGRNLGEIGKVLLEHVWKRAEGEGDEGIESNSR